ncbi:di-heme-cytochrome C peroxidase [Bradyrhizobium sp. McL0616]|uniref:di-heme-cytochrome C peroxidase n=1 Tax=Bradyrhizobium sp. McL0616 TaxID=3415674 RepID=UPI003CF6A334
MVGKRNSIVGALALLFSVVVAALVVIAGVVGYPYVAKAYDGIKVKLPEYPTAQKTRWLDQNWTDKREWVHHADQGTATFHIPYEWFMALEQPEISLTSVGLLSDPAYLDRFGFIPDPADPKLGLPVGMARGKAMVDATAKPWKNPRAPYNDMTRIGLTCAACHTGRFTYQGTELLVDGGPALTDLGKFRTALGLSLAFTRFVPFRFDRFAEKVIGANPSEVEKSQLLAQLDKILAQGKGLADLDTMVAPQSVVEGFGRLDALNRIGNEVFAVDLKIPANYAATSAPVHFPRIWDSSWFDWVQYNASIEQPMVRNAGEAMGVSAMINLTDAKGGLFNSGIELMNLDRIEKSLAGKQPNESTGFTGLNSPQWPSELPPVDKTLAGQGGALYKELCQGCHLPPVSSAEFWKSDRWSLPDGRKDEHYPGERYLRLTVVPITRIGTDPAQAQDMADRKVTIPRELDIASDSFGLALGEVTAKTITHWYDGQTPPVGPEQRDELDGYRDNGIQAPLAYKARPLNGIWATPPYLHNGSVPNLYALLSPIGERPAKFYLGNREYDPVNVGYRTDRLENGFELDTQIRGNHNTGHEFNNGKDGVIGRLLTPGERKALVEFLKTQ